MTGKWNISNNHFEDNGTAIEVNGLSADLNILDNSFINNKKDLNLYMNEKSSLNIDGNNFVGSNLNSITIESFNSKIEGIKEYLDDSTEFTLKEKNELKILINKMKNEKDNPFKLNVILKEVFNFSKSVAVETLASIIVLTINS